MNDEFTSIALSELRVKQAWDLEKKIEYAKEKIVEFIFYCGGEDNVYVSFSGGKDSTVLLHLVRSVYPNVKAVFFNTGLEFPEIIQFVKTVDNVEWIRPNKTVKQVWENYGVPAISKGSSRYIYDIRNSKSDSMVDLRLNYRNTHYAIAKRWLHFTDVTFFDREVSNKCCDFFKKQPARNYEKETGRKAIVGTMASESNFRLNSWIKYSCNTFSDTKTQSRPLSIWTEDDIWEYIRKFDLQICDLYYRGHKRTGCWCCPYGCHLEDKKTGTNRFERLKDQHPKHYKALEKLGIRDVLLNMQVPIRNDEEYMKDLEIKKNEIKDWYDMVDKDIEENGVESIYYKYHKYFESKNKKD